MALSNIFREPRREITETVVGVLVLGGALSIGGVVDYRLALWFQGFSGSGEDRMPFLIALLLGGFAVGFAGLLSMWLLLFAHLFGEGICNVLERRGVQLRPRRRFN